MFKQYWELSVKYFYLGILGSVLGKGGSAIVYQAIEFYTQSQVAIKVISLTNLSLKQKQHIFSEIQVHKSLNHPNITRIYEIIQTTDKICLVMELIKGQDLFQHVYKHGPLKESIAVRVFHQILMAVRYLHELGICHRDIKAQNIMIDSDFNAKLVDFGLSKRFNSKKQLFFTTFCGSPSYTPPQLIDKRKYCGKLVDIWCLGISLYVMIEACLPFDKDDKESLKQNILSFNYFPPIFSSPEAIEIYQSIFVLSEKRTNLDDLLNSRLLKKYLLVKECSSTFELPKESFKKTKLLQEEAIESTAQLFQLTKLELSTILKKEKFGEAYAIYKLFLEKGKQRKNQQKEVKSTSLRSSPIDNQKLKATIQMKVNFNRQRCSISLKKVRNQVNKKKSQQKSLKNNKQGKISIVNISENVKNEKISFVINPRHKIKSFNQKYNNIMKSKFN